MIIKKNLYMPRVSINTSLKCNLRCKLCSTFAPYYDKPYNPSLEQHFRDINRLFELVSSVGIFGISGGEPQLRNDLPEIIRYIARFSDRFQQLTLITNGTIIPNDEVIEAAMLIGQKFYIIIDNYGSKLSINAEAVAKKVESAGIRYQLRDYYSDSLYKNGWVDFLDLNPKNANRDGRIVFSKCAHAQVMQFFNTIINGKIYPCAPQRRCIELGVISENPNEVIDLFDQNSTDDEIICRLEHIYELDVLSACKYCNGLCEDSVRYNPAEQI